MKMTDLHFHVEYSESGKGERKRKKKTEKWKNSIPFIRLIIHNFEKHNLNISKNVSTLKEITMVLLHCSL